MILALLIPLLTMHAQVLQTLSILIQNIRSETAIFYLFSNNYINELISTKLVRAFYIINS